MQFLRKTALVLAASLFFFMLFGFGLLWGLERVFGTPDAMKTAFRESGIYTSIVGDALEQAQKEEGAQGTPDEIPIDRPEVRAIITQAFPPSFMQTQTEGLLDSIYNWLQGKTPVLVFNMDLADSKMRLADGVASYVTQRLSSLPPCTATDLRLGASSGDVDPFNAQCAPPGLDVTAVAAKARQEILNGEFMKDTKLTGEDLKVKDGRTFAEEYKNAPAAYQNIVKGVYAMGVIALLLGVAVVFLSSQRRGGIRKVSILALVGGSMLLITAWLWGVALSRIATNFAKTKEGSEPLQQKFMQILQGVGGDVRTWWLWFGFIVVVLAVGALVALRMTKPKDELTADLPPARPNQPAGESIVPTEHTNPSKPTTHKHKKR